MCLHLSPEVVLLVCPKRRDSLLMAASPLRARSALPFLSGTLASVSPPVSLTQRYLQRTFHVSRWDRFQKLSAPKSGKPLQRTASGKSALDKHKHTVLSVSRYGGNPHRQELAAAFRIYTSSETSSTRRETSLLPALDRVAANDLFAEGALDAEYFALYLNACLGAGVAPSASVVDGFHELIENTSDADDEELQHQAIETILCALFQLARRGHSGVESNISVLLDHPAMLPRLSKRLLASPAHELSPGMRCVVLHCWIGRLLHLHYGGVSEAAAAVMVAIEVAEDAIVGLLTSLSAACRTMQRTEFLYFVQLVHQLHGVALGRTLSATLSSTEAAGSADDTPFASAVVRAAQTPIVAALVAQRDHILSGTLPWVQGSSLPECIVLFTVCLMLCRDGSVAQDDAIDLLVHELSSMLDLCEMHHVADLLFAFHLTEVSGGAACTKRFVKLPGKWKRLLRLTASDEDWVAMSSRWAGSVECGGDAVAANHKVAFLRSAIAE
jgi:hypothetical protein